jgi:hypothetical protein
MQIDEEVKLAQYESDELRYTIDKHLYYVKQACFRNKALTFILFTK